MTDAYSAMDFLQLLLCNILLLLLCLLVLSGVRWLSSRADKLDTERQALWCRERFFFQSGIEKGFTHHPESVSFFDLDDKRGKQ